MKSKIKLGTYASVITTLVIVIFCVGMFVTWGNDHKFYLLCIIFLFMILFGLFYYPVSLETTDNALVIHRLLKAKTIPYSEIKSVDYFYPSAGGLRLCGSGGFMGYWGYFHDMIIGNYFGYYGNRDKCILVKLKSGMQYVLGCEDQAAILNILNENIGK